jgi:nucleoside-diphosphate-sugar epimerase
VADNFVTGSTGFLGSHLTLRLLRSGASVSSLVRGEEPRERLLAALARSGSYVSGVEPDVDTGRLHVLNGDLREPGCGVTAEAAQAGGTFWHLAANLRYSERHRVNIYADNVAGAREAVGLACALGCTRFVYISTAYTAGRRSGHIPEEAHPRTGPFNNVYEESKCEAEHTVIECAQEAGLAWVIARPAIVIGMSDTWSSGGSNSGLYGFAHRIKALRQPLRSHNPGVRLSAIPTMHLNLVAVDWVVDDLMAIGADPSSNGTFRHLTSDSSVSVQDVINYICAAVDVPTIAATDNDLPDITTIEKQLARQMEFYGNYLRYPKTFARSMPPTRIIEPKEAKQALESFVDEIEDDPTRKPAIW